MQQKIRIGILVNTFDQLQRWQISCVELLQNHPKVDIVFVSIPAGQTVDVDPRKKNIWKNIFDQKMGWKILWKWFKPKQLQELSFEWSSVPKEQLKVNIQNNRYELQSTEIENLKSYKLDVLLRLGWGILKGEILDIPKFGIWSFHHNDPHVFRGGPPAFWEIYHQKHTQGAVLQRINHKLDGGQILAETRIRTNQHSFKTSYDEIVKESPLLLQKAIAQTFRDQQATGPTIDRKQGIFKTFPNNGQVISGLCKILQNKLLFQWRKRFNSENWGTILSSLPMRSVTQSKQNIQYAVKKTRLKDDYAFRADPFLLPKDQGILYELYDKRSQNAVIAWSDLEGTSEKIVLDTGHHLSYPFIVEHEQKTYVIPEQKSADDLTVYLWNNEKKTLQTSFSIGISNCVDPTFVFYKGKWWLFCTHPFQSNAHLHIYYSDNLEGPYLPHSQNPVKMDVRSARPAGQIVLDHDKLYRPTQCNDKFYGAGMNWMEITELTTNRFNEKKQGKWNPKDFGVLGMHHVSFNDRNIVVDVKTKNAAF